MQTMKAVVFKGKDASPSKRCRSPRPGPGEAVIRITTTTICGTDVHIVRGEYPVKPGLILGHEPVGVIEELGAGLEEYVHRRPARHRRRDHAVRPVLLLPERHALAVRRRARRLALRQHHQRRLGGVPARAGRAREPRADSRRTDRRRGPAVSGHLLDRPRPAPRAATSRVGDAVADLRAGPDRPVRDARREAARARRSSSASTPMPSGSRWRGGSAPTSR